MKKDAPAWCNYSKGKLKMTLLEQKKEILEHISNHQSEIGFNETIFEILEGDLLKHVAESLQKQLSPDSYESAMERVAPINLFKKQVDKLSTVYVDEPKRTASTESGSDQDLVDEYTELIEVNSFMEDLNRAVNSYKWSTIELYEDEGIKARVLPSHLFLPFGNDDKSPTKVSAIIKFMGEFKKVPKGKIREKTLRRYWITSATEFLSIDSDGDVIEEDMVENEGVNEYGVLPYVFISKSRYLLVPKPDKDDLKMSILFPVLITDLNFAAKMLAHSVFYGIDIDAENLKMSPDAVWLFKSDVDGKKPEIGTITPSVSIQDVLLLAKEQIAAWLETKNIKVGSLGSADGANFASGVSKLIDESDTTVERKRQVKMFKKVELSFWEILSTMHNTLVEHGRITGMKIFSNPKELKIKVVHAEQRPLLSRKEKVEELKLERDAGFKSTETSIKELNPAMTEEQIAEEVARIEAESVIIVEDDSEQVDAAQS